MIPPNLTDHLQPPNQSVNKSFNNFVTVQYNPWYGEKVKDICWLSTRKVVLLALSAILKE